MADVQIDTAIPKCLLNPKKSKHMGLGVGHKGFQIVHHVLHIKMAIACSFVLGKNDTTL
jgi:hypothetical protein